KEEVAILAVDHMRHRERSAKRAAELITLQCVSRKRCRRILVEIAVGVESVVAQEIKRGAMQVACARLRRNSDHAAGISAVLRRIVAGENAELGDGVGIGSEDRAIVDEVVVQSPVEEVVDRVAAAAGDVESSHAVSREVVIGGRYAGLQQREIANVTSV